MHKKLASVNKYFGKNLGLMVHLGNGIGYTVSADMLEKVNTDLELGAVYTELSGFAEGFQTYQLLPKKENSYDFKINVNMNVGTVNNGKSAYIFQKNLVTKAYECVKVMPVSEIGNVAFTTTQISDVIVLVQE